MENQHIKIAGYRELNQEEIDLINQIKNIGVIIGALIKMLSEKAEVNQRWLSIGKTDLQKGFMALTRAVEKPESF